jgi:hypothetical protein
MRALTALLAVLALGCLLPSPHVAQDAPANEPAIELMRLYREKGRNWSYRELNWTRAGVTKEQVIQYRVLKTSDADCEVSRSTVSTFEVNSSTEKFRFDDKDRSHAEWAAAALPTVEVKLAFRTFACKKHRERVGDVDVTTWVSTEFHPLVVRQTILGKDSLQSLTLTSFEESPTDPWLLYRIAGRTWTIRFGTAASPIYTRNTVKDVTDTQATVVSEQLDKDMKPFGGAAASQYTLTFSNAVYEMDFGPQPPSTRETFTCQAGEFDCAVSKFGDVKYYASARWSGLIVGSDAKNAGYELIEFDLGHDAMRFYRAAGNKLVRRITKDKVVTTETITVTALEGNKATVLTMVRDAQDKEIQRSESVVDVPERTAPVMAYAGQDEVALELECGTMACIRTMEGKVARYHHHGMLLFSDGDGTTIEAIEIDIE